MGKTLETHGPASESPGRAREDSDDRRRSHAHEEDEGAAPIARNGSPFFADLVRAHYAWEQAEDGSEDGKNKQHRAELGKAYHAQLEKFCAREGPITECYWCVRKPSAIVLTEKPPTRRPRSLRESTVRIHRLNNWLMPRSARPQVDLLHQCD
jgi:hypothetical protein